MQDSEAGRGDLDNDTADVPRLLSLVETVSENLRALGAAVPDMEPLKVHDDLALTYYNRPAALTGKETKSLRKSRREFERAVAAKILPPVSSDIILEWGAPDSMRLPFFETDVDGKKNYIHVKEASFAGEQPSAASEKKRIFVTGTCLFGKQGVTGITDKGKTLALTDPVQMKTATAEEYGKIRELDIHPDFHGYEVLSAVSRQGILDMTGTEEVYFNIPFAPYVLYARDAIQRGLMDENVFGEWVEALAGRTACLIEYEEKVSGKNIIAVDPLYEFRDTLTDLNLSFEQVTGKIAAADPWWADYFRNNPPEDFPSIGYGTYVKVYHDLLSQPGDIELVAVEDQLEKRILMSLLADVKAQKLPLPAGNRSVLGVYPFIQVLMPDETGYANWAFKSDGYGRRELSQEIFAAAARSIPDRIMDSARASLGALRERIASPAAGSASRLPIVSRCVPA